MRASAERWTWADSVEGQDLGPLEGQSGSESGQQPRSICWLFDCRLARYVLGRCKPREMEVRGVMDARAGYRSRSRAKDLDRTEVNLTPQTH